MQWLMEVLRNNTKGATIVMQNGQEAIVQMEGNDLVAITFSDSPEPEYRARIQFVPSQK